MEIVFTTGTEGGDRVMKLKINAVLSLMAMVSALCVTSVYADGPAELDARITEARQVMAEVMATPDQSIPEELLAKCKAIAIYPNVLKGGFILGARFGKGVVLKRDEKTHQWGPVAFSTIGGGSWGLQIGGSATDLILVIMNERGLAGLLSDNFTLGGDAAVAAGPVGRNSEAATDLSLRAGIISYSRSRGLFAGIALDGAVMTQDNNSNAAYYGKYVTSKDILLGNAVKVQPSSKELIDSLEEYSSRWSKRIGTAK
jgi:lipid-binding SYLF domain-containing protein